MPETNKAKFLDASFQLEHAGKTFGLRGLISLKGATKVRVDADSTADIDHAFGHVADIHLGRLTLKGSLTKHFSADGAAYEVRFRDMDEEKTNFLQQMIEMEGVKPGWMRRYPRIPVRAAEKADLPVVTLCMIRFMGSEVISPVLNFSLGGLRIELGGEESLPEIQVGSVIHFDMMTSSGDVFSEFMGEVRNVSVSETVYSGSKEISRTIGVSFLGMKPDLKKKYHGLIRDFCNAVIRAREAP